MNRTLCSPTVDSHSMARSRRTVQPCDSQVDRRAQRHVQDPGTGDQRTGSIKCSYCVPGHIT